MKFIKTDKAPEAIGAYSQGVLTGGTLYVSGQLPLDAKTMKEPSEDIGQLTTQALKNILAVVEEANLEKSDIVRCGIFLADMDDFAEMNKAYGEFFGDHKPARAAVEVTRLPKNVKIEIDAIAVKQ